MFITGMPRVVLAAALSAGATGQLLLASHTVTHTQRLINPLMHLYYVKVPVNVYVTNYKNVIKIFQTFILFILPASVLIICVKTSYKTL